MITMILPEKKGEEMGTRKNKALALVMILGVFFGLLVSCSKNTSTWGYKEYNSENDETYNEVLDEKGFSLGFSLKYPPEWDKEWIIDDRNTTLLIASKEIDSLPSDQDDNYAIIKVSVDNMLFEAISSGQLSLSLEDPDVILGFLLAGAEFVEEPHKIEKNGNLGARAAIKYSGRIYIYSIFIVGSNELLVTADYPIEKKTEYQPILENIIETIKIKTIE